MTYRKEFDADLILESSFSTEELGLAHCSFEMFKEEPNHYTVEWNHFIGTDREDTTHIGLWFDEKDLYDYDGVFSLCSELIEWLEELGYNCDYAKETL